MVYAQRTLCNSGCRKDNAKEGPMSVKAFAFVTLVVVLCVASGLGKVHAEQVPATGQSRISALAPDALRQNISVTPVNRFIAGSGARKPDYCSCTFDIWAQGLRKAEAAGAAIFARNGDALLRDPMIRMDRAFVSGKGELHTTHMEETADDVLYGEAYPDLNRSPVIS
jgi:hypothetical protein